MTGNTVVDDDYRKKSIRISFNPFTERFEFAQPALDRSPEWVGDISKVFASALVTYESFLERLQKAKSESMSPG